MNIELNFDKKLITVREDVNLMDLIDKLRNMLPDYNKWSITSVFINNNIYNPAPITVNKPEMGQPWWEIPNITCNGGNYSKIEGTYSINVE